MMARFCVYAEKIFHVGKHLEALRDVRPRPIIPASAVFTTAFAMFATGRGSLHSMEPDLRIPARLRGLVGPRQPSGDTVGRVYAGMDSQPLRDMLRDLAHQLKRNKALERGGDWQFAAVDGHEFFRQPETLLLWMPDPHPDDRRPGGHRILSPRRGLPSDRA